MPATPTIHEVARRLSDLVANNLPGAPGVKTRDVNDETLCLAYGRAFRCFTSIRELAHRQEADDALVLTRTLVFVAMKALYVSLPEDPAEREKRFRSSSLTGMKHEVTMVDEQERTGFDISRFGEIDRVREMIARLEQSGIKQLPPEEQIANAIGFRPFYSRVFRPTSATAHYSLWSALDAYERYPSSGAGARVSLELPAPERADEALELACVVYGAFLEKSDYIIGHGISAEAKTLIAEHMASLQSH